MAGRSVPRAVAWATAMFAASIVAFACGGRTGKDSGRGPSGGVPAGTAGHGGADAGGAGGAPLQCTGPRGEPAPVDWFALAPDEFPEPVESSGPRPEGGFVVVGEDVVFAVDPSGSVEASALEYPPSTEQTPSSFLVSPDGNALLGRWDGAGYAVHDLWGVHLMTLDSAFEPGASESEQTLVGADFSESGRRVLAYYGWMDLESMDINYVRVHDLEGMLLATVPVSGGRMPASDDALIVTAGSEMRSHSLDGTLLWEVAFDFRPGSIAMSSDGSRLAIDVLGSGLAFVVDGQLDRTVPSEEAIWDVELSPSGQFTVASSVDPGRVQRFDFSEDLPELLPPLHYINSLDVADGGQVVLGGQDEQSMSHIMLYEADGALRWDCLGPEDDAGFRPYVRFTEDGRAVFAVIRGYYVYLHD